MRRPQLPKRLASSLALLLACAVIAPVPASAQSRYDDERDRYEDEDRYEPRRPYDERYDSRDSYEEREGYEDGDRHASRAPPPDGDDDPASSFEELDRYGEWRNHPRYGRVWIPDVDDDWRPYTRGYWVNTEEHGWYWESEEPFGWATFHYGRWFYDEDDSAWVWVPGNVWGPAWVAWREGEEEMGWAPLPPDAYWYPDRGLVLSSDFYTSPRYSAFWIFASPRYMSTPGLHRHVAPRSRANYFFGRTTPRHNHYRYQNRRIYNGGIAVSRVERFGGRPVPTVRINVVSSFRDQGLRGANRQTINVYRPQRIERARTERWRTNYTRPEAAAPSRPAAGPTIPPRWDGRGDRDRSESWRDRERNAAPPRGSVRLPEGSAPAAREPRRDNWSGPDRARERQMQPPQARPRESEPVPRTGSRPPLPDGGARGANVQRGGDAVRRDGREPRAAAPERAQGAAPRQATPDGRPTATARPQPPHRERERPEPRQPGAPRG